MTRHVDVQDLTRLLEVMKIVTGRWTVCVVAVASLAAGCKSPLPLATSSLGRDTYIRQAYEQKRGELVPIAMKGTLRAISPPPGHTGTWRMWYGNGILACDQEYHCGVQHGTSRFWNDDGSLFSVVHYRYGDGNMMPWPTE